MLSKIKDGVNYRYTILNPSNHRKTFNVEKRVFDLNTWKAISTKRIHHPTLESINLQYTSNKIDFTTARKNLDNLILTLYKSDKAISAVVHSTDNLKTLELYLESRYPIVRRRKLSDFNSARYECQRAIESLGNLSLLSATEKQIQDQVDSYCDGDSNRQRRIINKLKSILAFVRPNEHFELIKDQEEFRVVKHLTETEFNKVLPHLPKYHQILASVCFHTGARVGETFAFSISDLREKRNTVLINKQITKEDHEAQKVKSRTKNKKIRETFIFPEGISAFKKWVEIKESFTKSERLRLSEVMKAACIKVYPRNKDKHLVWHDLRHSYAIRLLDKGLTIDTVSKLIGDSSKVAEKHYTGFIVSEPSMDLVRSKVL